MFSAVIGFSAVRKVSVFVTIGVGRNSFKILTGKSTEKRLVGRLKTADESHIVG